MQTIYELKHLFKAHGIDVSELWREPPQDAASTQPSLVGQFLASIWESEALTELELQGLLYGCPSTNPSAKFRKLKERVMEVLATYVIDIDRKANSLSREQRNYYAAHRELVIAKILEGRGGRKAARYYYLKCARRAATYDLNYIGAAANQALRYHASRFERSPKQFNLFHQRHRQSFLCLSAEYEAAEYYSRLVLAYGTSPQAQKKTIALANSFATILDEQYELTELGPTYAHYYYLIRYAAVGAEAQYLNALTVVNEAIDYFDDQHQRFSPALSSFLLTALIIRIVRREFDIAHEVYDKVATLIEPCSSRWLKLQELGVLLSLYEEGNVSAVTHYQAAAKTLLDGRLTCSIQLKERWLIIRIYLYLLHAADQNYPPPNPDPLGENFKARRALNNILLLDKEKSGGNLPIMFAELLFLLFDGQLEAFETKLISSERYMDRHVKAPTHFRSKCFFRALLRLPQSDYHATDFQKMSHSWFKKLTSRPPAIDGQSFEIEVVPYERLYKLIINHLERRHPYDRRS